MAELLKPGTVVERIGSSTGYCVPSGTRGVIKSGEVFNGMESYMIRWEGRDGCVDFAAASRIRVIEPLSLPTPEPRQSPAAA